MSAPKFDLWLSAGSNGVQVCGDPTAHHIFMRCLFHSSRDATLRFDVNTINVNRKSAAFMRTGLRKVPSIQTQAQADNFETEDEILDFLEFLAPPRADDAEAERVTQEIFMKFARFLKNVDKTETHLNNEMKRLDEYLEMVWRENENFKFLVSDTVEHIDCMVLTRLHSIRISGKHLKNYEIPYADLPHLRQYMLNGYETAEFRQSCPSDQEIVLHWAELRDTPKLEAKTRAKIVREPPVYSFEL